MITMAMALTPKVLIADEPTSSVDVTLEAAILEELKRLRLEHRMSMILISHNLGVIAKMANQVAVMYAGCIVETADVVPLFHRAFHPYTAGLLASVINLNQATRGRAYAIRGVPPDPVNLPDQCPFLPRCHKAISECRLEPQPVLRELEPGHWVACYNPMAQF
jgi:oligopeptide transport system ATP-binding protein